MRAAIIGFVIGACLLQIQAALPAQSLIWLLLAMTLLSGLCVLAIRRPLFKIPFLMFCGVCLGFMWAALFAQHTLAQTLPKELEGADITVIGTIDSLPFRFERGVRFNFAVERAIDSNGAALTVPSKLSLAWYSAFRADERQPVAEVRPGERWQMTVRLRRPHGNANPYVRVS